MFELCDRFVCQRPLAMKRNRISIGSNKKGRQWTGHKKGLMIFKGDGDGPVERRVKRGPRDAKTTTTSKSIWEEM